MRAEEQRHNVQRQNRFGVRYYHHQCEERGFDAYRYGLATATGMRRTADNLDDLVSKR